MRAASGVLGILMLLSPAVLAAPSSGPLEILKREGRLVVVAGGAYYALDGDGGFRSGPLGISGRTIEGRWRRVRGGAFEVQGNWGWANGASLVSNDRRKMRLLLQGPCRLSRMRPLLQAGPRDRQARIHTCRVTASPPVRVEK